MGNYDSWKTTEPDREPSPGEHRPYDAACDCDECQRERNPPETRVIDLGMGVYASRFWIVAEATGKDADYCAQVAATHARLCGSARASWNDGRGSFARVVRHDPPVDTRPRYRYRLPDGRVVRVIHDHGEHPLQTVTYDLGNGRVVMGYLIAEDHPRISEDSNV